MFGKIVSFLIGTYAGIYFDQHYQLPRVDDPAAMMAKIKEFAQKYEKDKSSKPSD